MATSTYLTNPTVNLAPTTGGQKVDLTDQCRSATVTLGVDSLESTAFGDTGHRFVPGLMTVADLHWSVKSTFAPPVVGARFTVGFVR